jgi:hypothetical protein
MLLLHFEFWVCILKGLGYQLVMPGPSLVRSILCNVEGVYNYVHFRELDLNWDGVPIG